MPAAVARSLSCWTPATTLLVYRRRKAPSRWQAAIEALVLRKAQCSPAGADASQEVCHVLNARSRAGIDLDNDQKGLLL